MNKKKIKVLIVDDSALIRQSLKKIFQNNPSIEIIGTASDPYYAARIISKEAPDVITLDIQMPKMNGITFLQKIMSQHPIPVVIISSLAKENSDIALKAWQLGAIDVIEKPLMHTKEFFENSSAKIIESVKAASIANLRKTKHLKSYNNDKLNIKKQYQDYSNTTITKAVDKIVLIGASAGGTEVIANILSQLPKNCPPIIIAQHMPEQFTLAYSRRLDSISQIKIKEAENGDKLEYGKAYVAKGNTHILIKRRGQEFYVETNQKPKHNLHRPSIDILFNSAVEFEGRYFLSIILSGMGRDGVRGVLKMRKKGAKTIAQNEESSIVFGMPKEAILVGAASKALFPDEIISEIINF